MMKASLRRRVLVAEDEAVESLMIHDLLTESGFVVVGPAVSTKEALSLIEQEAVDCAVLDIKLVDGPSPAVAEALAARGIPFVVTTGCDGKAIHPAYNGAPILRKVFMPEELIEVLADLRSA